MTPSLMKSEGSYSSHKLSPYVKKSSLIRDLADYDLLTNLHTRAKLFVLSGNGG